MEELAKVAEALEMTGGVAASRSVKLAIEMIAKLQDEAKREREAAAHAMSELAEAQTKMAEASKLVSHYKSKDLEPTVDKLKSEVERLKLVIEEKVDHISQMEKDLSETDKRYAALLVEHQQQNEIRRKVELMNSWRATAAEVMSRALQGEMNKEDALKIAGFVTAGQKVPYHGIDPHSFKMWKEISGEIE